MLAGDGEHHPIRGGLGDVLFRHQAQGVGQFGFPHHHMGGPAVLGVENDMFHPAHGTVRGRNRSMENEIDGVLGHGKTLHEDWIVREIRAFLAGMPLWV